MCFLYVTVSRGKMTESDGRGSFVRKQPIRKIPISPLQSLEHASERLKPNHEMTDNHRRAEVSSIMEGFLPDTFQVRIPGACGVAASVCQCTHRF